MLGLILAGGLVATIVALALGGRLENLGAVRLRATWLMVPALAATLLPVFVSLTSRGDRLVTALAFIVVGAFLALNIKAGRGVFRAGLIMIALGWAMNFVVILANGGMPLSSSAYAASGQTAAASPGHGGFYRIVSADDGTRMRFLGDVIPIRVLRNVLSPGDLILAAGFAVAIGGALSLRPAASPTSRGEPTPREAVDAAACSSGLWGGRAR
jgi:hypothetical protein